MCNSDLEAMSFGINYSVLSARMGSMAAARRAGIQLASKDALSKTRATAAMAA
jgi:hypothetical protein